MGNLTVSTRDPGRRRMLAAIAVVVLCAGCSEIRLIGGYDEQIDTSATELQKRMDKFLTTLEADPAAPSASFEACKQFYLDYEVDLRAVQIRAQAQPKYDIVENQFKLMSDSVAQLKVLHEAGPLLPETVAVTRDLINQAWGAIFKLQRELQRG